MFDTYLKLERNAAMERAINRCRKTRLKAHTVSIDARLYSVPSRSIPGTFYVVQFNVANGERFAACNCQAGQRGQMCVHIAAAYVQHVINMAMRRQAEKSAADYRGFAADDAGVLGHHPAPANTSELAAPDPVVASPEPDAVRCEDAASGSTPDYPIEEAHNVETFCAICGRETGNNRCPVDTNAEILTREELDDRDREARRELFRRMLDGLVADDDRPARPGTLRAEIEAAVLVKQPMKDIKIGGFSI